MALALLACGDGGDSAPTLAQPGSQTLELRPGAGTAAPTERRVVARFDVLRELPDWVVRAGRAAHEVLEADERREALNVLALSGGIGASDRLEVRIPGRFVPSEINRIAIDVLISDRRTLEASLVRQGREIVQTQSLVIEGAPELQRVVLDLLGSGIEDLCDHVSVSILGEGEPVRLAAVELLREPMVATLPSSDAPELLEISGQWARAAGLSSRHPLECSFTVREGAELVVDYGLPHRVRLPGSECELRAQITSESGTTQYYLLSLEHEQIVQYSQERVDLLAKERQGKRRMAKISSPRKRRLLRQKSQQRRNQPAPEEAFGVRTGATTPAPQREEREPPKRGLVEAWCSTSVPLDDFVGEDVVVRFELLETGIRESVCALSRPRLVVPDPRAPTVLLITSDAHRADHLALGDPDAPIETPWLDKLAERGVVFESAWAPSNGLLASHAALQSGTSPRDTGLAFDGQRAAGDVHTLAERFRQAGWRTIAVLSSGVLFPEVSGLGQGFDRVFAQRAAGRGVESVFEDLALACADSRGVPLFAWVHLSDANAPYEPPTRYRREHYPEEADPYEASLPDPDRAPPEWDATVRDLGYVEALYSAEITWIDRNMRAIVEHPRFRTGLTAFAGTYGESLETFGHGQLTPETLRVPLILAGGGLPAGMRVSRPVQVIDLGRTLLELAGLPDAEFPGTTLRGQGEGQDQAPRFALSADGSTAAIVRDGSMLTLRLGGGEDQRHTVQLFDVASDPVGREDLARERAADARALRAKLVDWLLASAGKLPAVVTESQRDLRVERWMEELGLDRGTIPAATTTWIELDCRCEACAAFEDASE